MAVTALEAVHVRRRLDPAAPPFQTTAEVPPLHGTIGQERALDAVDFGLEVPTPGYNLFVAGAAGSGRESTIVDHLERVAATRPAPDDLVPPPPGSGPGRPLRAQESHRPPRTPMTTHVPGGAARWPSGGEPSSVVCRRGRCCRPCSSSSRPSRSGRS